jgi:hypothetical protein
LQIPFYLRCKTSEKAQNAAKSRSLRHQKRVKALRFDVFPSIWRTFELHKKSLSWPRLGEIVRQNAYLVAESGGNKCQLSYSVEAI